MRTDSGDAHRFRALGVALSFCTSLALYLFTLCPTAFFGDSGGLSLAAYSLGVAHPPGYPLYVWWGRIASMGFGANPAMGTNVLSAVCAAATVALLFRLILIRTHSPAVAALMAGVLACAPVFWSQATVTEVYALAALALMVYLTAANSFVESPSSNRGALLAYLSGLACVVHPTLCALPVATFIVCAHHHVRPHRSTAWLLLGLTPLFGVFLSAQLHPIVNFGNPDTWKQWWLVVSRLFYESEHWSWSWQELVAKLSWVISWFQQQLGFPVVALSGVGMALLARRSDHLGLLVGGIALTVLVGVLALSGASASSVGFYQMSFYLMSILPLLLLLAADGAVWLVNRTLRPETVSSRAFATIGTATVIATVAVLVTTRFAAMDRSDDYTALEYGQNLMRQLPAGATLIVDGDNESFLTLYAQFCGSRRDVTLVHRKGYLFSAPRWLQHADPRYREQRSTQWVEQVAAESVGRVFTNVPGLTANQQRFGVVFALSAKTPPRDARLTLAGIDTGLCRRDPSRLDFLARKAAMTYLQVRLDDSNAMQTAAQIDRFGFDMAPAQFVVGTLAESRGDLVAAYDAYRRALALDPRAPLPARALQRLTRLAEREAGGQGL